MITVVPKAKQTSVGATYPICAGVPVTGAGLIGRIRMDGGPWQLATNSPVEVDPVSAPGYYDMIITSGEMNAAQVDWVMVDSGTQKSIAGGKLLTEDVTGAFATVFGEPVTEEDRATRQDFFNCLADSVLRRSQCHAEQSECGDGVSLASLLGVISLLTQGQTPAGPDCNGQYFITAKSACQGGSPVGQLRVIKNTAGAVIAVVPTTGPNTVSDADLDCYSCGDNDSCP